MKELDVSNLTMDDAIAAANDGIITELGRPGYNEHAAAIFLVADDTDIDLKQGDRDKLKAAAQRLIRLDDRDRIIEAILSTKWPDGVRISVGSRVAGMIADAMLTEPEADR